MNNYELALCYIGECMYWKRVLSNTEILDTQQYLFNKTFFSSFFFYKN